MNHAFTSKYLFAFGVFIIIAALTSGALALKCWDCNSLYNPGCGDPFQNTSFAMADCDQKFMPRYPNQPGTVCRKIIQKVNDDYRYIRGCGYVDEDGQQIAPGTQLPAECIKRAGTFSVLVQYCSCNSGDGCNHAAHMVISYISTLVPLILVIAKLF